MQMRAHLDTEQRHTVTIRAAVVLKWESERVCVRVCVCEYNNACIFYSFKRFQHEVDITTVGQNLPIFIAPELNSLPHKRNVIQ